MFQRLSEGTGSGNPKITLLFKNIHNFPFIAPDILQSAGAKMSADPPVLTAPTEAAFEFPFTP